MWQQLADVLSEIHGLYQQLLRVSHQKQDALVMVDMKGLDGLLRQQEKLVAAIQQAEERRQKLVEALAGKIPAIRPDTKMAELYNYSPDAFKDDLKRLHAQLDEVTVKVRELEQNNTLLVNGALSAVNYRLNQISGAAVEPGYGTQGEELVSRRKKFDFHA